jgi:hypothetical protein
MNDFKIKPELKEKWMDVVGKNCCDGYSFGVVVATVKVFEALDAGKAAEESMGAMHGLGITGYMAGCVAERAEEALDGFLHGRDSADATAYAINATLTKELTALRERAAGLVSALEVYAATNETFPEYGDVARQALKDWVSRAEAFTSPPRFEK